MTNLALPSDPTNKLTVNLILIYIILSLRIVLCNTAAALLLNFIKTFYQNSRKLLKICVYRLLLLQILIFVSIAFEYQIEKWIILALYL